MRNYIINSIDLLESIESEWFPLEKIILEQILKFYLEQRQKILLIQAQMIYSLENLLDL